MPGLLYRFFIGIILLGCFSSCANYKAHYAKPVRDWEKQAPDPQEVITHSLFLIGDAGAAAKTPAGTQLIKQHLDQASANSTVLFLGDNIYPVGMPPETAGKERKKAEANLDAQIAATKNFPGKIFFLPGNHDWADYFYDGIHRQEEYIEAAINQVANDDPRWQNVVRPDNACPGPELIDLTPEVAMMIIDSEWWIMDWDKAPGINANCEIKSREAFAELVAENIKSQAGKHLIIATHHPFRTYGPHGGKYTWKDHIFPVTAKKENFYLPLPGLGSLLMLIRSAGVIRQDVANKHYKSLGKMIIDAAKAHGNFIFVSGHEHSIQYNQDEGQDFIVSGSGSKTSAVAKNKKSMFGYGKEGFARLDFYENGSVWLAFWVPRAEKPEGELVFRWKVRG